MVHKRNKKCFIRNCKSGYITNPEKCILFPVPSDPDELEEWEISIGRKLSPDDVVCEKHFAPNDVVNDPFVDGEKKLSEGAVPTELTYLTKKRRRGRPSKHNVPLKKRKFLGDDDDADYVTQTTVKLDAAKIMTPARAPPVVKLIQPGAKPKVLILMHKKPNILNKNVKMINLDPKTLKIIENIKLNAKVPKTVASDEVIEIKDSEAPEDTISQSPSEFKDEAHSDSSSEFSENSEETDKSTHENSSSCNEELQEKKRDLYEQRKLNLRRRKKFETIRTLQAMKVLPKRRINILKKKDVIEKEPVQEVEEVVTTSKPAKVPVPCFIMLYEKNLRLNLPPFWGQSTFSNGEKRFVIFTETYFENQKPSVKRQAILDEDNQLSYFFNGRGVKRFNLVSKLPVNISTLQSLEYALTSFTSLAHCPGGPGENEFRIKGSRISVVDLETSRWRHLQCCMVMRNDQDCCKFCRYLYKVFKFAPKGRRVTPEDRNFALSLKNKDLQSKLNRLVNRLEVLEDNMRDNDLQGNTQQNLYSEIKHLPMLQRKMIIECLNSYKKRGQRYSLDWIRVCINIYSKNATMYDYLKNNNILPLCDVTTVKKYIKRMSGVNESNDSDAEEELEECVSDEEDKPFEKEIDIDEPVPYCSDDGEDNKRPYCSDDNEDNKRPYCSDDGGDTKRIPQIFEDFE